MPSTKVAANEATLQYLRDRFPDAKSDPERFRAAISALREEDERTRRLERRLDEIEEKIDTVLDEFEGE